MRPDVCPKALILGFEPQVGDNVFFNSTPSEAFTAIIISEGISDNHSVFVLKILKSNMSKYEVNKEFPVMRWFLKTYCYKIKIYNTPGLWFELNQ